MKKILVLLGLLLILTTPTYAKTWSTNQEGSLCAQGTGEYKARGYGDFYFEGSGTFRFPLGVPVGVTGYWETQVYKDHIYYSGEGTLDIENYEEEIVSSGTGDGYIRVEGVGSIEFNGVVKQLEVGC